MAVLKTDSPLSRRIATSFLQFLNSVEPSAGVDSEALEVAKECLAEVFKIDQSSLNNQSNCDSLIDIFGSGEWAERRDRVNGVSDAPTSSLGKNEEVLERLNFIFHWRGKMNFFGQFFGALEKIHYFRRMPDGNDDNMQLDRATNLFHNAVRAAAYTQIQRYAEAVRDCQKSIEINPNYSKAYNAWDLRTYAQGKYRDAIDKGFIKALQLDPNNDSVKENIRVAEQKLNEEQQRTGPGQSSTSTSHGSRSNSSFEPPPFSSMPFNINGLPGDITSMLMNMTGNAFQGHPFQNGPEAESQPGPDDEPEIRIGGNMNFNVNELPEEFSGAFRSMMGMFSGAAPNGNQQDNSNGQPPPS